ncbi:MAG: aminopeptidase P family protein [Ignavibacteriaceae bacterium]|nr:aminopeptidase P family protein [Ignavibacteriaceae bacterium]
MNKFNLKKVQDILINSGLEAWLFFDFRGSNDLALSILDFKSDAHLTRRFFYLIPAKGDPVKIVHAIEAHNLAHLPGTEKKYSSYKSLHIFLAEALAGKKQVAMEYSPMNSIPYVSKVDGGTIELIRSFGVDIVSSADLITLFDAVWTDEQYSNNIPVGKALVEIVKLSVEFMKSRLSEGSSLTEYDVQQFIMKEFEKREYFTDHPPIVGVNENAANPHYAPTAEVCKPVRKGDLILIDLWAKDTKLENSVWSDITWMTYAGEKVPERIEKVFNIVRDARDAALQFVTDRFNKGMEVRGWEIDECSRKYITDAGYGEYFIHRTGHSITTSLHGSGPHLDNFETKDERKILPSTSFSIEPGIYLPGDFGIRCEIDVFVHPDGRVEYTGGEKQKEIICF